MSRSTLYILLSYGLSAILLSQLVGIAQAQHRNIITAQIYLAYNENQQLSFAGRMAGSQQDVIDDCAAACRRQNCASTSTSGSKTTLSK